MTKESKCGQRIVCKKHDSDLIENQNSLLKQILKGDTYVLGKMWIDILKAALVGEKLGFFPTVYAAPPKQQAPSKPPPMKYKNLPLYDCPHSAYKQHLVDKEKHPYRNYKILHLTLLPTVKQYRRDFTSFLTVAKKELIDTYNEVTTDFGTAEKKIKSYFRDPKNMAVRQGVVALGGLTGLYVGRRKSLSLKLVCVGLGSLIAGSLTFPDESDEVFRTMIYHAGHVGLKCYNFFHSLNLRFRERTPCSLDKKEK